MTALALTVTALTLLAAPEPVAPDAEAARIVASLEAGGEVAKDARARVVDGLREPVLAALERMAAAPGPRRLAASEALCLAEDAAVAPALEVLVRARAPRADVLAARCLVRLGDAGVRVGSALIADPRAAVALVGVRGIRPFVPARSAVEALLGATRHGDDVVVQEAAGALDGALGQDVRERLAQLMVDGSDEAAERAGGPLVRHGSAGILEVLRAVEARPRRAYRATGARRWLLARAVDAGLPAGERLRSLPTSTRLDPVRELYLEVIGRSGRPSLATIVAAVAHDPAVSRRSHGAALAALARLGVPGGREALVDALRRDGDDDPDVLDHLARAAGALGDPSLAAPLLDLLRETPPQRWRVSVVRALGRMRADAAVGVFYGGIFQAPRTVQTAILAACQRIGSRLAVRMLMDFAIGTDWRLRGRAIELLRRPAQGSQDAVGNGGPGLANR